MNSLRKPTTPMVIATCLAVLLVGCGDGSGAGGTTSSLGSTTTSPTTPTTGVVTTTAPRMTTTSTEQALEPVGNPGTAPYLTSGFPGSGETAHLTGVRVGSHEGFERLVFEFAGGPTPEYRVEYVDPPIVKSPSGNEIDVLGDAFVSITMSPATGFEVVGEDLMPTYEGPERIRAGTTSVIQEVVRTEDFENVTAWVVGLDEALPFGAAGFEDPSRLVIDFRSE